LILNNSPEINKRPRFFYGYVIVALSYLLSMLVFGVFNSFGVFFDPIINDLGWSKALTSGAFAVSTIAQGFSGIVCGKLTDRIGPRFIMTICGFLLGTGYLFLAHISNPTQFYLVYGVIIGIGVGGFWVPLLSTISRWFSLKRGLMLGIFLTGAGAGMFVLPPFINLLIQNYQWRMASTIIGILSLIFCIILPQFIKRDPSLIGQLPDGSTNVPGSEECQDNKGYSFREALNTKQFWIILSIFFCCGLYSYIIIVHVVPYAIYSGISPSTAANILAISGIFSGFGAFILGVIADRIGVKKVALGSYVIIAIALLWFLAFRSIWQLYVFGAVFGFAFGGLGIVEMLSIVWLFGLKSNAFILSVVDLALVCGAALGPVLAGHIFDIYGSYQYAFILCVITSIIPVLLIIFIKPTSRSSFESK
jgi:MFS family permease